MIAVAARPGADAGVFRRSLARAPEGFATIAELTIEDWFKPIAQTALKDAKAVLTSV
jgi:hypothetical protein